MDEGLPSRVLDAKRKGGIVMSSLAIYKPKGKAAGIERSSLGPVCVDSSYNLFE